jgi:hypothetical protein
MINRIYKVTINRRKKTYIGPQQIWHLMDKIYYFVRPCIKKWNYKL